MTASGIYKIQSKIKPERFYIGSAVYLKHRWTDHLRSLRNNKHHSDKLQRHFNKYGEIDLVFSVIEPCMPQFLIIREDSYFNPLPYFNICPKAGSQLGLKRSEETKQKLRKPKTEEYKRNQKGPNTEEWKLHLRKPKSEQGRKNMSKAAIGRIPWNKGLKGMIIPWNKGKTGVYSKETIKIMTESRHKRGPLSEIALKNMSDGQKRRYKNENQLNQ